MYYIHTYVTYKHIYGTYMWDISITDLKVIIHQKVAMIDVLIANCCQSCGECHVAVLLCKVQSLRRWSRAATQSKE